jgi:hypothetical protein
MRALTAKAIHSARPNLGSRDGGCGEQQDADMVAVKGADIPPLETL